MNTPQCTAAFVDPSKAFDGTVVITVPHMDDEVLACGGTIARLPQKDRIHLIYATDGSRSPAPLISGIDCVSSDLSLMRMRESRAALKLLGLPDQNLHFLGFPEGRLKSRIRDYSESLLDLLRQLEPDHVITPFRFDRHPDHLTVNRATTQALRSGVVKAALWEFFVYYRWRLLRAGDIRKYIRPDQLVAVNIQDRSEIKRRALDCFNSQTTILYWWQERPILPQSSLEEVCRNPEFFLRYNPLLPGAGIFVRARVWIRFAHLVETPLKTKKDQLRALVHRRALVSSPGRGRPTEAVGRTIKKTAGTTDLVFINGVQSPRICLLTETYHPVKGGGETQARALAENLSGQGFTVCVVARRSNRTLKKIEIAEGVTVYRISPVGAGRWTRWRMLAASFLALTKLRDRYDILFVSGFKALGVSAVIVSKVFHKTCILKADSNGEMSGRFFSAGLKQWGVTLSSPTVRLIVGARNAILRRADAFVAITTEIAEEFKEYGIEPALIHRTPNSVDTNRFHPVSTSCKESLRTRLALPKKEIIVTYTGRLVSYKGLPLLVRVAEQLQKKHRNTGFVLVGAGGIDIHNCEAILREYVTARGLDDTIRFTGEVDNVEQYLQASDIFVSPTEKDAFPLALIEAMACGLAVVSTPIGGIKEMITSQKNGLLVEVGSFDQLYKAIETLIVDPAIRASLGSSAVQSAEAQYSAKSITARYAELFRATRLRYVANP